MATPGAVASYSRRWMDGMVGGGCAALGGNLDLCATAAARQGMDVGIGMDITDRGYSSSGFHAKNA